MLIKSIDETITTLLSRGVTDALYSHLERVHSISKGEIPNRLEALLSTLEGVFGDPSTKTISKAVARNFYRKLELPFREVHDAPSRTLLEYVEEAKMKLRARGS